MNNCLKINKFLCFLSSLYPWKWHYFQRVPKSCSAVASANGRFFWRPMNLTCKLLFPLLFFNTYSTHNNIQYDIKAKKNKIEQNKGRWRCWWFIATPSTWWRKKIHLGWSCRTAHLSRGEVLTARTLKFWSNSFQVNKLYEKYELSFVEDGNY